MKDESKLLLIKVLHEKCNTETEITENFDISSSYSDCDMCGSHGETVLDFFCIACNKWISIEIDAR